MVIGLPPYQEVLIWSVLLSFILAILYRVLTNPGEIRTLKNNMKELREKANKALKAGEKEKSNQLTNEMLKMSGKQMKYTMKPMMLSFILFFVFLGWIGPTYADMVVTMPVAIPFLGSEFNWFWWYLIITVPMTLVFRKLLGVE